MIKQHLLVTGDRNYNNLSLIKKFFEEEIINTYSHNQYDFVHGGCRGADLLTAEVAERFGYELLGKSADWQKYGRAAGPIRNKEMVSMLPAVVMIFHNDLINSKGTKNCLIELGKMIKNNPNYNPVLYYNGKRANKLNDII